MKISIITVVFNNVHTVEDTIRAVEMQNYPDVEHIVIDGASTDGTLEVLRRHQDKIAKLVSEPDRGIFDAMNKGLRLATGDVVGFLNADDIYADSSIFHTVGEVFTDETVDACYADLVYVDPVDINNQVRYWKSKSFRPGMFSTGWVPAHPTFFARRAIYVRDGGFDESLGLAADYELMLRLLERHRIKAVYVPKVFVKMRLGGASNRSLRNIVQQNIDIYRSCKKNQIPISPWVFIAKPLAKLSQYFMKPAQ